MPRRAQKRTRRRWISNETHPDDRPADAGPDARLAWYMGIALMAAFELIDWPVALAIAVGHEIAYRARTRALRELAEGVEAGG